MVEKFRSKQASKQASLDNCTFVKTILMLLVIIYHSCVFWNGNWFTVQNVKIKAPLLAVFAQWLNSFHVYGFTLISGYLFHFLKNEEGRYSQYIPFVLNKIRRLLIPYVFIACCWIVPISVKLCNYSLDDVIDRYIWCTNPSQLWFLWMLFDVFIIIWPLNKFVKNDLLAIIISAISWGIGFVGGAYFKNLFCIWTALNFLPYFILGMKLREKNTHILYRIPSWVYIVLQLGLFFLEKIVLRQDCVSAKVIGLGNEYALHIVGALMSFFVLQSIATNIKWKDNILFSFFSTKTMPVYLFHQQIIYFTIIWLNGKVNPYINATINFLVSVTISLVISGIFMKFKWTRRLIGEK